MSDRVLNAPLTHAHFFKNVFLIQRTIVFRLTSLIQNVPIIVLAEIKETYGGTLEKQVSASSKHHIAKKDISRCKKHGLRKLKL